MSPLSFSTTSNSRSDSPLLPPSSPHSSNEELEHSELCRRLQVMGIEVTEAVPKIGPTSSQKTTNKSKEGKNNNKNSNITDKGYYSRATSTISSTSITSSNATEEENVWDDSAAAEKKLPLPSPALLVMVEVPDNWLTDSDNEANKEQQQQQLFIKTTLRQRRKHFSLGFDFSPTKALSDTGNQNAEEENEPCKESEALVPSMDAFPGPLSPFDKLRKTVAERTGMDFIFPLSSKQNQKRRETSKKLHKLCGNQRRQSVARQRDFCYWQMLLQALKTTALL